MNWVGGARSRMRCRGEKKIQKEYFERQKFVSSNSKGKLSPISLRSGVSQDLLALQTVTKAHSNKFTIDGESRRMVRKIDLARFRPTRRMVEEVELGPSSPCETPSKIQIMESKDAKKLLKLDDFKCSQSVADTHSFVSVAACDRKQDGFDSSGCQIDILKQPSKTDRFQHRRNPILKKFSNFELESVTPFLEPVPPTKKSRRGREPGWLNTSENSRTLSDISQNLLLNPWAVEDFQRTPLMKYQKKMTISPKQLKRFSLFDMKENMNSVMCNQRTLPEQSQQETWKLGPLSSHKSLLYTEDDNDTLSRKYVPVVNKREHEMPDFRGDRLKFNISSEMQESLLEMTNFESTKSQKKAEKIVSSLSNNLCSLNSCAESLSDTKSEDKIYHNSTFESDQYRTPVRKLILTPPKDLTVDFSSFLNQQRKMEISDSQNKAVKSYEPTQTRAVHLYGDTPFLATLENLRRHPNIIQKTNPSSPKAASVFPSSLQEINDCIPTSEVKKLNSDASPLMKEKQQAVVSPTSESLTDVRNIACGTDNFTRAYASHLSHDSNKNLGSNKSSIFDKQDVTFPEKTQTESDYKKRREQKQIEDTLEEIRQLEKQDSVWDLESPENYSELHDIVDCMIDPDDEGETERKDLNEKYENLDSKIHVHNSISIIGTPAVPGQMMQICKDRQTNTSRETPKNPSQTSPVNCDPVYNLLKTVVDKISFHVEGNSEDVVKTPTMQNNNRTVMAPTENEQFLSANKFLKEKIEYSETSVNDSYNSTCRNEKELVQSGYGAEKTFHSIEVQTNTVSSCDMATSPVDWASMKTCCDDFKLKNTQSGHSCSIVKPLCYKCSGLLECPHSYYDAFKLHDDNSGKTRNEINTIPNNPEQTYSLRSRRK